MQAQKLFRHPRWPSFASFLAGDSCRDGVTVIGTSWGGAIAEILSGCANQNRLDLLQGAGLPSFQVAQMYTFGAPPTALITPIDNHQDGSDSCFRGQRVFIASDPEVGPTDLVAYSTGFHAYLHARVDAVQLIKQPNGNFDVKIHPCRSQGALIEPAWTQVLPVLTKIWSEHALVDAMSALGRYVHESHQMSVYVQSLRDVQAPYKLTPTLKRLPVAVPNFAVDEAAGQQQITVAHVSDGVKALAKATSDLVANGLFL